eukprot:Hpha_TRINITY_DN16073_c1_g1::TRINITY_DN16073_c1_g1_i1::g.122172::m.122172
MEATMQNHPWGGFAGMGLPSQQYASLDNINNMQWAAANFLLGNAPLAQLPSQSSVSIQQRTAVGSSAAATIYPWGDAGAEEKAKQDKTGERKRGRRAGASAKKNWVKKLTGGSLSGCIIPVNQAGAKGADLQAVQGLVPLIGNGSISLKTESLATADEEKRIDPSDGQVLTNSDFMMKHMVGACFDKAEELWAKAKPYCTVPVSKPQDQKPKQEESGEEPPAFDEPPALLCPMSDDEVEDDLEEHGAPPWLMHSDPVPQPSSDY